jgi:hypothetical protein
VAQVVTYLLYAHPVAFYLDGFTTSLVQVVTSAVVLTLAYRPFFKCHRSSTTVSQRILGALLVVSFFMLTAMRAPIPLWPLVLCVVAGLETNFPLVFLLRAVCTLVTCVGCWFLTMDVVAITRMGMVFWAHKADDAILLAMYAGLSFVYSVALFALSSRRVLTTSMHTADLVRLSFLYAVPILLAIWALSWIPLINLGNQRFGTTDPAKFIASVFYVPFSAMLKVVIVAAVVEAVKFGQLYTYMSLSALSYVVFPLTAAAVNHGQLTVHGTLGLGLLSIGSVVAFMQCICCTPEKYRQEEFDRTCDTCATEKTWLGFMWAPSTWWPQGGSRSHHANRHSAGPSKSRSMSATSLHTIVDEDWQPSDDDDDTGRDEGNGTRHHPPVADEEHGLVHPIDDENEETVFTVGNALDNTAGLP